MSLISEFENLCGPGKPLRREAPDPSNRYIVFQVLPHTLGLGPEVWRILDKGHDARNLAEYEGHLSVTERLVEDLIVAAGRVASALAR